MNRAAFLLALQTIIDLTNIDIRLVRINHIGFSHGWPTTRDCMLCREGKYTIEINLWMEFEKCQLKRKQKAKSRRR